MGYKRTHTVNCPLINPWLILGVFGGLISEGPYNRNNKKHFESKTSSSSAGQTRFALTDFKLRLINVNISKSKEEHLARGLIIGSLFFCYRNF